jgi:SAM-dependent methyltransferase
VIVEETESGQPVYFNELAGLFRVLAADTDSIYRGWLSVAVPDLADRPGSRAVDLGCGSGRFTGLLAQRHREVLGIDIAAVEIDMASADNTHPNVDFQTRSLLDVTARRDGRFDTVLSVNAVHQLRDNGTVLPHLRSLVAPGGHLVVVDLVDPGGWASGADWHIRRAFGDAAESYLHRSQDLDVAFDLLRLQLHPLWLRHATEDIPSTRAEFEAQYTAVFPGVRFTELRAELAGACWQAPA